MSLLHSIQVSGGLLMGIGLVWIFPITARNIDLIQVRCMKSKILYYRMVKKHCSAFTAKTQLPNPPQDYSLLEEFAEMEDVLNSTCIEGVEFRNIIIDDNTEILGQD